jgi:hypothetical protein
MDRQKLVYDFIRNSQAVIAKDAYAKALYEEYNRLVMPAFPLSTDRQIDLLLDYIASTLSHKQ